MRRSRMPVRLTIHSSLVSRMVDRSWLVSTAGGRHFPQPVIAAWVTRGPPHERFVRIAGLGLQSARVTSDRVLALAPPSLARLGKRPGRTARRERVHRDHPVRPDEVRGGQGVRLPACRSAAAYLLATAGALRLCAPDLLRRARAAPGARLRA